MAEARGSDSQAETLNQGAAPRRQGSTVRWFSTAATPGAAQAARSASCRFNLLFDGEIAYDESSRWAGRVVTAAGPPEASPLVLPAGVTDHPLPRFPSERWPTARGVGVIPLTLRYAGAAAESGLI